MVLLFETELSFEQIIMLSLIGDVFFFILTVVIVQYHLDNLHRVVSHFFNLPLGTLDALPSLVLTFFDFSITQLKLVLLEVVV